MGKKINADPLTTGSALEKITAIAPAGANDARLYLYPETGMLVSGYFLYAGKRFIPGIPESTLRIWIARS